MLTAAVPPQPVPVYSGFDYVTVDAQRRRVYAAHSGSHALLIVDADSGKVLGQVRVGESHGVAVDPVTGNVFVGADQSVSEVDPVAMKVLRKAPDLGGPIDAIAYDGTNGHIYADEDDGTHVYVLDAKTMQPIKTITVPGHKPEYLAINPRTHEVYQNIDNLHEVAVIDGSTLDVTRTIPTNEITHNHPLQYDAAYNVIVVGGGANGGGALVSYRPDGKKLGETPVARFDQCSLDPTQHILACAGGGGVTRISLARDGALHVLDTTPVDPGVHTVGVDPVTHAVFPVWGRRDGTGDFVQRFVPAP